MTEAARPSSLLRTFALVLVASSFFASLFFVAAPASGASGANIKQTFTGAPGFPELGGPGEVLSIDAGTASTPGGSGSYTSLKDLVLEEAGANQIAPLAEDSVPIAGTTLVVDAPAPFAWESGSGSVSVTRLGDPALACGSLRADLTVTTSEIRVVFARADTANACVVTISGIKVIPTAPAPLVAEALLVNSGSAPGVPVPVGVLALTTSAGSSPTIMLSSSARVTTCCRSTEFVAAFASQGANRPVRFEQSLDGVTWTGGETFTTDAQGVARFALQPRFNRFYRVVFVGGPGLAAGVSNSVRVVVRFGVAQVPVHSRSIAIRTGTAITVTTTVKPVVSYFPAPRVEFRLYHRTQTSGPWTLATVRVVPIDSLGRAAWRVTFAGRGDWYVRSRALGTSANAGSVLTPIARYWVR